MLGNFFLFDVRYDVLALLPLDLLYLKFGRQCTLLRYFKGMWRAFREAFKNVLADFVR